MNNNELAEYKDIFENINVQNWFKMIAIKEPLAFSAIIGDNRKKFQKIFGKDATEYANGNDKTMYWRIQEQGLFFIISIKEEENQYNTHYLVKYTGNNFETDV